LSRAGILIVRHAVSVAVGASTSRIRPCLIGTSVASVENPIAVCVTLAGGRTSVASRQARFFGTSVRRVRDAIAVPVRAAVGGTGTCLIRAKISFISHSIAVQIRWLRRLYVHRGLTTRALSIEGPHDEGVNARRGGLPVG
jgi:hypothetical protein